MTDDVGVIPSYDLSGFRITGELLSYRIGRIRLHPAGNIETSKYFLLLCKFQVDTRRIGVVRSMRRRIEAETAGIDTVSGGKVVGLRIASIDKVQQGLIRAARTRSHLI